MMTRRFFCESLAVGTGGLLLPSTMKALAGGVPLLSSKQIAEIDDARIIAAANHYLAEKPITLTAYSSPRNPGGPHDYFSEGDYWWPDPKNPGGPYIRRDGLSNPQNFNDHREALIRLSLHVPALTAAWLIAKDRRYADHANAHLKAWFVTPDTRMNPNLEHAQAIFGVNQGRGVGIIDTIHLAEVARSAALLMKAGLLPDGVRAWFVEYLQWITTSKNGIDEREATNNHGSCWVMQVAAFASFTGDEKVLAFCRDRYRSVLVPKQVAANGSFPQELARTKPYSYSLFNLDILATCCHILDDGLWEAKTPGGQSLRDSVAFYAPFIADKAKWPYAHDVEYFDDLPVRQPSLLFAGLAYRDPVWIELWRNKKLNPDPTVAEIIRNFPIRQPLLWVQG
jgi:Alginate lyase